jgi:hypothetical protein
VPQRDDQGPGGHGHRELHRGARPRRRGRRDRLAVRNLSRHRLGKQGSYFFQRVIEHGRRRAEEVREVAQTVREAGLTPWSAQGTAERQAWMADLADAGAVRPARRAPGFARSADWRTEADRILAATRKDWT